MAAYVGKRYTSGNGLDLYYRDYGTADGRLPVVCLPGLTRNSADFETLALHLSAAGRRVISPDFRGRGLSAYDPEFMNYVPPTYAGDTIGLLAGLGIGRAFFVGTSLGGIVTQLIALAAPSLVAGAVLNDIGPELDPAGLARIASYAGLQADPATWDEAVAQIRTVNLSQFPDVDDATWARFARAVFTEKPDGGLRPNYDPKIGDAMRAGGPPVDMWPIFAGLGAVPTLVLRGVLSDLLASSTVERMKAAKPDLVAVEVPGRGHAPFLDEPAALAAIDALLARVDG
ncbi:alpha/beta fold hydrolase [Zavarzinia compransoris]|uniref:Alpha/beta hydrolase n=1 Tax=Zavarzinia compransoris TaxID=1264899 RepID=A0A317E318_9PROT|nr:alpha/beta hydrolase [Zavarzinia compransoris]PWR21031.1 alpha/beta hydrolase [Zavarzinia compransoris]TDP44063.1 pimeloyl-ACP methyl ester carboxylesterase [Zavarzinia compransoris]